MKKVRFLVSFKMNLFFHLEVISGSVPVRFNKKYISKYPKFISLAKKFRWNFDPQTISWYFKKRIEKPNAFEKAGIEFGRNVEKIFKEAAKLYKPHWENEIKKRLENFEKSLEKEKNWLDSLNSNIQKIENITKIPFSTNRINIYLVEALSQEYGKIGGEPLINGIAVGRIKDLEVLKMVITHELVHLNLMNRIINLLPEKYRKEEHQINEAITDLIARRVLNLSFSKEELMKNPYIEIFQPFFQNVSEIKNLEKILKILEEKNKRTKLQFFEKR